MKARKLHDRATGAVYATTKTVLHPKCGCAKQGYTSRKVALQRAAEARRDTSEPIHAYRCTRGGHVFHIGHPPGWRAQQARTA